MDQCECSGKFLVTTSFSSIHKGYVHINNNHRLTKSFFLIPACFRGYEFISALPFMKTLVKPQCHSSLENFSWIKRSISSELWIVWRIYLFSLLLDHNSKLDGPLVWTHFQYFLNSSLITLKIFPTRNLFSALNLNSLLFSYT